MLVLLGILVVVLNEVFPTPTDFAAPVEPVYVVAIKPVAFGTAVAAVLLIAGSRVRVD